MDITSAQFVSLMDDTMARLVLPARGNDAGSTHASAFWATQGYTVSPTMLPADRRRLFIAAECMAAHVLRGFGVNVMIPNPLNPSVVTSLINGLCSSYGSSRRELIRAEEDSLPRGYPVQCYLDTNSTPSISGVIPAGQWAVLRVSKDRYILASRTAVSRLVIPGECVYGRAVVFQPPSVYVLDGNNVVAIANTRGVAVCNTAGRIQHLVEGVSFGFSPQSEIIMENNTGNPNTVSVLIVDILDYCAFKHDWVMPDSPDLRFICGKTYHRSCLRQKTGRSCEDGEEVKCCGGVSDRADVEDIASPQENPHSPASLLGEDFHGFSSPSRSPSPPPFFYINKM